MPSASAGWEQAQSMVDSAEDSEAGRAVDLPEVLAAEAEGEAVVDAAEQAEEEEDEAEIRTPAEAPITVNSRASATAGANSPHTQAPYLSPYKIPP